MMPGAHPSAVHLALAEVPRLQDVMPARGMRRHTRLVGWTRQRRHRQSDHGSGMRRERDGRQARIVGTPTLKAELW
eukprot:4231913-Prymnesium_polylepis.2